MKHRAIRDLNQLKDEDLFLKISVGLEKIHENCVELNNSSACLLENQNYRAFRIIDAVAKEEAAKYLILIDVLRCPRNNQKEITRQLAKFNDHMAKGVYAELCGWNVATYRDLRGYIEAELEEFYLDGPMDVDWIFRNEIISKREEAFYVDYVQYDEEHDWLTPKPFDSTSEFSAPSSSNSAVISIIKALHNIGIANVESIKLFSRFWREFEFTDTTHYQEFKKANLECLEHLDKKGLLNKAENDQYNLVINSLPFPLYREEMKEKMISIASLKEIQSNWCPEL
jgi:AbiV family abortive infection protein